MKLVDYVCKDCGKIFEIDASVIDQLTAIVACPDCGSTETRKKFSVTPIIYKAKGFSKNGE